jgi:hypothetical protein
MTNTAVMVTQCWLWYQKCGIIYVSFTHLQCQYMGWHFQHRVQYAVPPTPPSTSYNFSWPTHNRYSQLPIMHVNEEDKVCEYLKIMYSQRYLFGFLCVTKYLTPLSIPGSYKGILFWLYLYLYIYMAHNNLIFLSALVILYSDHLLMHMVSQNINTPVPHYDNNDHYSFSFVLTLPILFPSLCSAAALLIQSNCNATKNDL